MSRPAVPFGSVRSTSRMVVAADQLATQAGMVAFDRGGNAVDAAVAAAAAMAVTAPHLCGMGGDLFAVVHTGRSVAALNASGRAGSGADAGALRQEGRTEMPFRHDVRAVTAPGCVDGWVALHDRFGRLPLADVLAPAIRLAEHGFPASPLLVASLGLVDDRARSQLSEVAEQARRPGGPVRRPGVARMLTAIASQGRDAFYGGEFGAGLVALAGGVLSEADVTRHHADWVEPLTATAFGVELHTIGPNSQGYLLLGAARLASGLDLPDDPDDDRWPHLLVEAATAASHDRPTVLHDRADGGALLGMIEGRVDMIDAERASRRWCPGGAGDTTYLCTADSHGMAVSLIQSNASGFGSWIVEPRTGINLHNRGIGFSLEPGHPAEYAPGRRPPHTLCPALATRDGDLAGVFGTMGGDAQPQILLQVAARLFVHGQTPAQAVAAARWALRGPVTGFDTWTTPEGPRLVIEAHAPASWAARLTERGHRVHRVPAFDNSVGHAHAIVVDRHSVLAGAADPRARVGSAAGL